MFSTDYKTVDRGDRDGTGTLCVYKTVYCLIFRANIYYIV